MATIRGNNYANTIYGTASGDFIYGLGGNDKIYGKGGADRIDGGAGNDRICGGAGADILTGGTGSDVFAYTSVSDLPFDSSFSQGDWITDWNPIDVIDLSAIDANSTLIGNQAFTFAGYSFGTPVGTLATGKLAIAGFGGELYIVANTDGDAAWELCIGLWSAIGESGLTVADLIL